jgi:UDP-2,4-diacetamido-2,4,6-trideoxy-beta-L-altropyranose hydrolase
VFVCRDLPGNVSELVRKAGFSLFLLPAAAGGGQLTGYEQWLGAPPREDAAAVGEYLRDKGADCLIVDHYALDIRWESLLRPFVRKIMVIDDLADRPHDCDILLDQNYLSEKKGSYGGLVPPSCRQLLGLPYALLREEFFAARSGARARGGQVRNVLIFYGGADDTGETIKVLRAFGNIKPFDCVNVLTGQSNGRRDEVKRLCDALPGARYFCQVDNMADFVRAADVAFGACGTHAWERCFLGLPAIVTAVAENQAESARALARLGAVYNVGFYGDVTPKTYERAVFLLNTQRIRQMSEKALSLPIGEKTGTLRDIICR